MKASKDSVENAYFFSRRPDDLLDHIHPRKLAKNGASPYHFAYARTALKYGLTALGFNPGDVLLVPDLICESLLEPLESLGIEPCYYPVDRTLLPDWGQLDRLVSRPSKALLIVHYFGQPQPVAHCIAFCREHGLMLIEDNAHGFGGIIEGQLLGTYGEIGIAAPRKSFPIKNGALLYVGGHQKMDLTRLQLQPAGAPHLLQRCKQLLKRMPIAKKALKRRAENHALKRRLGPPPAYGSQEAFRDPPIGCDYGMDQYIAQFLEQQNISHVREIRQQIYAVWREWADIQGLDPVFPTLAPGALPLVFPAYTHSPAESRQWFERGHRAGIDIHSWPTLPPSVVKQNGNAMRLWEHMICFPIHQDMDLRVLNRRLAVL